MNFEFEVEDNILRQKNHHKKSKQDLDNLFCSFVFTTQNWKHIDKYAVFWNRKGKSTIRYISKGVKGTCELPEMVLNDLYFYVQVYANDNVLTQKLKVFALEDVPKKPKKGHCKEKKELNDFFEKKGKGIDNIVYDNGKFLIYSNNQLIKTIDVVDEQLMARILNGITPSLIFDTATSESSDLPIACKLVYKALKEKVNLGDLSIVAFTGDYNDLDNIPSEFPSAPHTHITDDITDFDSSVEEDFDDFIDILIQNL